MKGIETRPEATARSTAERSDHCPAMKGIETMRIGAAEHLLLAEATTAPQ